MHRTLSAVGLAALYLAFGVALLVGGEAAAASPSHLSVRVNGRVLRVRGQRLKFAYEPSGSLALIDVTATKGRHFNRTLNFVCVGANLTMTPQPVTFPQCSGLYQETRLGLPPSVKAWQTAVGVQVTIEAFDGTRARGTFTGTLEFFAPGRPPASFRNGTFDADVSAYNPTANSASSSRP
jgi:hypothetical protein